MFLFTALPETMQLKRFTSFAIFLLYACATLQFVRFYAVNTVFYLHLPAYLAGKERLPFQERILPALLMRGFYHSPLAHYAMSHGKGAFTPERAPFFIISLASMVTAGFFAQRLYRSVSRSGAMWLLVYPVFLFCMMWTYAIHTEANFSYPYDMLAVAFFSAGLYFIYSRQYVPLVFVILIGTFNRETTLFLIGIYVLDSFSDLVRKSSSGLQKSFSFKAVSWFRVVFLFTLWLAIKLMLSRLFAGNDNTENHVRLHDNFMSLQPRLWPALLNICGYMLPMVLLLNRDVVDRRFRSYLWILPLWFGVMFYTGVIVETRIYGELCPYVAVALVLILERRSVAALQQVPQAELHPVIRLKPAA